MIEKLRDMIDVVVERLDEDNLTMLEGSVNAVLFFSLLAVFVVCSVLKIVFRRIIYSLEMLKLKNIGWQIDFLHWLTERMIEYKEKKNQR